MFNVVNVSIGVFNCIIWQCFMKEGAQGYHGRLKDRHCCLDEYDSPFPKIVDFEQYYPMAAVPLVWLWLYFSILVRQVTDQVLCSLSVVVTKIFIYHTTHCGTTTIGNILSMHRYFVPILTNYTVASSHYLPTTECTFPLILCCTFIMVAMPSFHLDMKRFHSLTFKELALR